MVKVKSKQIQKVLAGLVFFDADTTLGEDTIDVTAALTTALETAGDNGTEVPLQVSTANGIGVVTTGNNIANVYDENGLKIGDAEGNEVYARITEAAGVYTANLFVLIAGVETAYDATAAETLKFAAIYKFGFDQLPTDSIVGIESRYVVNDPIIPTPEIPTSLVQDILVPTGVNTLPNSTFDVDTTRPNRLIVNSMVIANGTGAYTVAGKVITWSAAGAGFALDATDSVVFEYFPVAS